MFKHMSRAIAVCIAIGATALPAATQVDTAKGQVLLELQATGRVTQLADVVEMTCLQSYRSPTKEIAIEVLGERRASLTKALKAGGLDVAGLSFGDPELERETYYSEAEDEAAAGVKAGGERDLARKGDAQRKFGYLQPVALKLAKLSQRKTVEIAMDEAKCRDASVSLFAINNPGEAERKAKDNALAEARKQADSYAKSLNMKVLRVARVGEYSPVSALIGADASELATRMVGAFSSDRQNQFGRYFSNGVNEDEFLTMKTIWVDFVLTPN